MTRAGPELLERLADAPLTYTEVGATYGELPDGYAHLRVQAVLGTGRAALERAGTALLTWRAQRGAGSDVLASQTPLREGTVVAQRMRIGPLHFDAPCRVVAVRDEPDRRGFAYGSLPGHPAVGEERFEVRIDESGTVWGEVVAFSRPGRWYTRLGAPAARLVQRRTVRRYLRALAQAAAAPV